MVYFWWHDPLPFPCWLLVPPRISKLTGKTVIEGGNVTLNCSAEGKPSPSITWTRLSDNVVVTMPLINITRHGVIDYRCVADNGVGIPAIRDVTIDVQCKCCNEQACTQIEYNVCVYHIYTLFIVHPFMTQIVFKYYASQSCLANGFWLIFTLFVFCLFSNQSIHRC